MEHLLSSNYLTQRRNYLLSEVLSSNLNTKFLLTVMLVFFVHLIFLKKDLLHKGMGGGGYLLPLHPLNKFMVTVVSHL